MALGDARHAAATSVILRVPSAVVPQEWNYVVNPAHADFARLRIGTPRTFPFDPRLAKP